MTQSNEKPFPENFDNLVAAWTTKLMHACGIEAPVVRVTLDIQAGAVPLITAYILPRHFTDVEPEEIAKLAQIAVKVEG